MILTELAIGFWIALAVIAGWYYYKHFAVRAETELRDTDGFPQQAEDESPRDHITDGSPCWCEPKVREHIIDGSPCWCGGPFIDAADAFAQSAAKMDQISAGGERLEAQAPATRVDRRVAAHQEQWVRLQKAHPLNAPAPNEYLIDPAIPRRKPMSRARTSEDEFARAQLEIEAYRPRRKTRVKGWRG